MRERAFAVIGDRIVGTRFLDLYAGTGAVGLEALSRGARSVVFVERHRVAVRLIEKNSAAFDLGHDRVAIIMRGAKAAVAELARRGAIFDIAWVDPPFENWREGFDVVISLLGEGAMENGALVCFECPEKADLSDLPADLEIVRDLAGSASRVVMITSR
jgi:16S rRNA (guanine(966)-N(2))-methyltransferase RsmD